jgi:2-amino-4-hydroxy-6-hydroxymethyldihydropteridine diphosphokinase
VISQIPIVLGLGCNTGPRRATLERSVALLEQCGVRILGRSRLYWSRPWGVTDQADYLNAAVSVQTGLRPQALLSLCFQVERQLGRRRKRKWGPRRIDVDLLLYGAQRIALPGLKAPHPYIAQRDFVLAPLIDLGVPPVFAVAPRGWRALLRDLPVHERTLIHSEPWSPHVFTPATHIPDRNPYAS